VDKIDKLMGKLGLLFFRFLCCGLDCGIYGIILPDFFQLCYITWLFISNPSDITLIAHYYSSDSPRKPGAQCDLHIMEVAERS